jgi:hypothetical protein
LSKKFSFIIFGFSYSFCNICKVRLTRNFGNQAFALYTPYARDKLGSGAPLTKVPF